MENERGRTVTVVVPIMLLLAVGVAAFGIRYKTVNLEDRVLMVERWTGRAVFIYSDGSSNMVESGRSVRGPALMAKTSSNYAGVQLRAKLKWRSARVHYLITAQPYGDVLQAARKNRKNQVVIDFLDRDGFVIKTLWIPVYKMSTVKNGEGKITSLEYQVSAPMCIQDFRDIRNWNVR